MPTLTRSSSLSGHGFRWGPWLAVPCRSCPASGCRCVAAAALAQCQHVLLPRRRVTGTHDALLHLAAGGQGRALDPLAQRRLPYAPQVSGRVCGRVTQHRAMIGCSTRESARLESCWPLPATRLYKKSSPRLARNRCACAARACCRMLPGRRYTLSEYQGVANAYATKKYGSSAHMPPHHVEVGEGGAWLSRAGGYTTRCNPPGCIDVLWWLVYRTDRP